MDRALAVAAAIVVVGGIGIAIVAVNVLLARTTPAPLVDIPQTKPPVEFGKRLLIEGPGTTASRGIGFTAGNIYDDEKVFYFNAYSLAENAPSASLQQSAVVEGRGYFTGAITFEGGSPGIYTFTLIACPTEVCVDSDSPLYASMNFPVKVE